LIIGASQGCAKEKLLNSDQLYVPADLPNGYWTTETATPLDPCVAAVSAGSYKHRDPPQIKASGFVIETMEAALWAFYHTNSFEEGALKAVNLGGDADTVGTVYGMLAGAY
jgi:ADP-ribosyl-[dinitrogen reductase] hydrolase